MGGQEGQSKTKDNMRRGYEEGPATFGRQARGGKIGATLMDTTTHDAAARTSKETLLTSVAIQG